MTEITQGTDIKPLGGAIVRKVTLGATTTKGDPITLKSDGKWDPSDADAAQLTVAVAVQGGVDTDVVDAVVLGPIQCLSSATPGVLVYTSNTEGDYDDGVASTKDTIVGYAESASVLFVLPQIVDLS